METEYEITDRIVSFHSPTYVQAVNGDIANGRYQCNLTSGSDIQIGVQYDPREFSSCSTVEGGFSAGSLSSTYNLNTVYGLSGYNGRCQVFYGVLPTQPVAPLTSDALSVGGKVFIHLGNAGCLTDFTCNATSHIGNCDATLGQESTVPFSPLNFHFVDLDGSANTVLEFTIISGNDEAYFSIDKATGQLSLESTLDRDSGPDNFSIVVEISDSLFNSTYNILISVLDQNDNAPMPSIPAFTASIPEGSPAHTPVLNVTFIDADIGDNSRLEYSLQSADFTIDTVTGEVFTTREFDYEEGDLSFSLVVSATDNGEMPQSGSVEVTITIEDVNDNHPTLNVSFVEGVAFVEEGDAVRIADIVVSDDDITFDLIFAIIEITDAVDINESIIVTVPNGVKTGYTNSSLYISGKINLSQMSSILQSAMYINTADEMTAPLNRTVVFSVCDQFIGDTVPPTLSQDTQSALSTGSTLDPTLPLSDITIFSMSCMALVSSPGVVVPLIAINDRPVLVQNRVYFQNISEDVPNEENRGEVVGLLFRDAIEDSDGGGFVGVALTSHFSSADPEIGIPGTSSFCFDRFSEYTSCVHIEGINVGPEASKYKIWRCEEVNNSIKFWFVRRGRLMVRACPLPPPTGRRRRQTGGGLEDVDFSNVLHVHLTLGTGFTLDLTSIYVHKANFEFDFSTVAIEEYEAFTSANGTYVLTYNDGNTTNIPLDPVTINYISVGDISETSAVVAGPYNLIRFAPHPHAVGPTTLGFKAWDGIDGIPPGTFNVNTTDTEDNSFSLETGNATIYVTSLNDPPEIELGGPNIANFTTTYTENSNPVPISANDARIIERDENDVELTHLEITISKEDGTCDLPEFGESHDTLFLPSAIIEMGINFTNVELIGDACIKYTISETLGIDVWNRVIQATKFQAFGVEPSDHRRQLEFVISDELSTSLPSFTFIDVELISDICPVLQLSSTMLIYTEHSGPLTLDPSLNVTDGDRNPQIQRAIVSIPSSIQCDECVIKSTVSNPEISASYSNRNQTVTLEGPASPSTFQTLLRGIQFEDEGDEPTVNLLTIQFLLIDPDVSSCSEATGTISILIEHVNDNSPIIFLDWPYNQHFATSYTEGTPYTSVTGDVMIHENDAEQSASYTVFVSISECVFSEDSLIFSSGGGATVSQPYNVDTCSLELAGSISELENDIKLLRYANSLAENPTEGKRIINFTISDFNLPVRTSFTNVTVIAINDPPQVYLSADSTDLMVQFQLGDVSVSVTDSGTIIDRDNSQLQSMSISLLEYSSSGMELISPSDGIFEGIEIDLEDGAVQQLGLAYTERTTTQLMLTGATTLANYITILNKIVYFNRRIPPTLNRREVSVIVNDGEDESAAAVAMISFVGALDPPVVDLNGGEAGRNSSITYTSTTAGVLLFPSGTVTDPNGDQICQLEVTLTGDTAVCPPESLSFTSGGSDIELTESAISGDTTVFTVTSTFECRNNDIFENILRSIVFQSNGEPGNCTVLVIVQDDSTLNSTAAEGRVEVVAYNDPPFVDLDLGYVGRDYSTVYYQSGQIRHIVSIFNATTSRNISTITFIGEADGEAAVDGFVNGDGVLEEQSNAGYRVSDSDSSSLTYLQVEFVKSSNPDYDVIRYPCKPQDSSTTADPRGCTQAGESILVSNLECDDDVFEACSATYDLCTGLQIRIFCSTSARKAYRFIYPPSDSSVERYEALLGYLGYEYLLTEGGNLNQVRSIDVSVSDGQSTNPQATTRVKPLRFGLTIPTDPVLHFIVYEDERPERLGSIFTVPVETRDGLPPEEGSVRFQIISGNEDGKFRIDSSTGEIFLQEMLDREEREEYRLQVSAQFIENSNEETGATSEIVAEVIDVNDEHPLVQESFEVNVTEGTANLFVVDLNATDADEGINAELMYLLLGIGVENFYVTDGGIVKTRNRLNVTVEDYYLLVVIVFDMGFPSLSAHSVLHINVITPSPTNLSFVSETVDTPAVVSESQVIGYIFHTVEAFEVGGTGDKTFIRYEILSIDPQENPQPFAINSTSGELYVHAILDSERNPEYQVQLRAFSVKNIFRPSPGEATLEVIVLDDNEHAPEFLPPLNFTIAENSHIGALVGTLVAIDRDDMNTGIIYSLDSSVPPGLPFYVQSNGNIVVAGTIDYESDTTFNFTVLALDIPAHGETPMTGSAQITVDIEDQNDNPPQFVGTPYHTTILETAALNTLVISFTTIDSDTPENSDVSYSSPDINTTPFCLHGNTIKVCDASQLTLTETQMTFVITLVATNPPAVSEDITQTSTESVSISLILVNEFDPVFPDDNVMAPPLYEEHCGLGYGIGNCIGFEVYDFNATDADGGPSGDIEYTLLTEGVPFEVNRITGELNITGRIDREFQEVYSLQVRAEDGPDSDGTIRSTVANITIIFLDIDDNVPVIRRPFEFVVTENMTRTTSPFGSVQILDPDITGTHMYNMMVPGVENVLEGCVVNDPSGVFLPIEIDTLSGDLHFCVPVDYEAQPSVYMFSVIVLDSGSLGPNSGTIIHTSDPVVMTVTVVDFNDHTPIIEQDSYIFSIEENVVAGIVVGEVVATDEDSGEFGNLQFSLLFNESNTCSEELPFVVLKTSNNTADIQTCLTLDYEQSNNYNFELVVCDNASVPMCDYAQVVVGIEDRNDHTPLFTSPTYTAVIEETDSSLQETLVITVAVTDADSLPNSVSDFSILPLDTPFGLRAETSLTAEIYVAQPHLIDYDSGIREYNFTVLATNEPATATDVTLTSATTILVNVTDMNDNTPNINPPYEFDIYENQIPGTVLGCISASDDDDGVNSALSYSIVNGSEVVSCSDDIPFSINNSGCLLLCETVDYESTISYTLTVRVCDGGFPMLCAERAITVSVIDLNDNPLVYTEDEFFIDLPECVTNNHEVLVITSTDEDSDPNSLAIFEFINTASPFAIQNSRILYTGVQELDYENGPRTYILHLQGTNPPAIAEDTTWVVYANVTVNIVDCNDHPPVFDPAADIVVIPEHDSSFTYTLSTSDSDSPPNSLVSYTIVEPSPFTIVGNTIQVSDSAAIDFDPPNNISQYILTVMATNPPASPDDETQTANLTLSVNVTDINDNAPQCDSRDTFSILENATVSVSVRRYRASDIDSGENGNSGLLYDINDSGAPGSGDALCTFEDPFRIYPESGYIYPCVPLDFERQALYRINITVRDSGSPTPMVTICPVVVTVLDANDNIPVLNPPTTFSVAETAPVFTAVGCINGTDTDSEENGEIVYTFEELVCTVDNPFHINSSSGCISVCHGLDFETDTAYHLTVVLTDNAYPFHSTSGIVTISVENENDHAPAITSSSIAYVVEEQANAEVITVEAEDLDAPPFNIVTFSLPDDAGGLFAIDSSTGTIRTALALDRETTTYYSVTVTVSDGVLTSNQDITIILIDINDNLPIYQGSDSYSFMEETIFQLMLVYTDEDSMNNSLHSFSVNHSNFSIDSMGNLSNLVPLDRDPATGGQPSIDLTITVMDGSNIVETDISINLIDINDNAPVAQPPFQADILDGTEAGTTILTVTATDADSGDNARLEYGIDGTSALFAIDATSGNVTALQDITLSSDMSEELILTVRIRDNGVNRQTTFHNYTFTIVNVLPQFPQDLYEFNINENDLGGVIDTITAMDRDRNPSNDNFVYMILSVTPYDSGFRIESDGSTGTLYSPRNYFDFEDSVQFYLRIAVSRENMTIIDDETIVRVIVEDRNDNPPRLSPLNIEAEVPEDIANGDTVLTAIAIDFDRGNNGILSYNHSGMGEEAFEFDSSGNFKVVDSEMIDFELESSFVFRYQACDSGNPQLCSESGMINITITDVDDIPPVFNPNAYTITISEDFEQNREILSVEFGDEDTPLTDVILSLSPPQTLFEIAQVSGALMTTNIPLDREATLIHEFYVVANDTSGQSSRALVIIILSDVNDERPHVEPLQSTTSFEEGGSPVLIASSLSVVDRDDISIYPLTSIDISLHPSPGSIESYPLTGGICDHANYSFYDENVYTMCGFSEQPCLYLLDPGNVVVSMGGSLTDKILTTGSSQGFARNTRLFSGTDFDTFSVSLWLRLESETASGSVFELRTTQDIELNLQVDAASGGTGRLTLFSRTQTLLTTSPLDTHDNDWHHITLVRDAEDFTMYFDGIEEARGNTSHLFDDSFAATTSFLFGMGLETEYISEVYLCFSNISRNDVQCALTCGESFELQSDTADIDTNIDFRTRSVHLEYTGSNNATSLTQLQQALQKVQFRYDTQIEEPNPLDRGIFVRVSDIIGASDERGVITLVADLVNDKRPILDLNGISQDGIDYATIFEEHSDGVDIIGGDAALYDEDSGFSTMGRIEIEILTPGASEEIFSTGTVEGLRITQESNSQIVINSSTIVEHYPDRYLDALRTLRYHNLQDEPVQTSREIQFTVYDMGLTFVNVPLATTNVTVMPTNDRPVLDLDSSSSSTRDTNVDFREEEGKVRLLTGTSQSIDDPDSDRVMQAVVKLTVRPDNTSETLQLNSSALSTVVSETFDLESGTLTLDGTYTFVEWLEILRRVVYVNTYGDPDENTIRQVSMQVVDSGGAISEPAYINISVIPFNNPPVIYLGGPDTQNFHTVFVEDGPCIPIANLTMEIVDVDSQTIEFARASLQNINADLEYETIQTGSGGPQGTYTQSSRFIFVTLNEPTLDNFALALPTIMYCNTEDEPDDGTRQIEVAVRDTGSRFLSAFSFAFIDIQHVNDQPSLQVESLNNISIRGVPTVILNKDSIVLEDSDDNRFRALYIFITNAQDGVESETIIFEASLPANTTSLGSLLTDDGQILNNVTFRGEGADANQVIETIANVRYRNTAANLTVDPPRIICLQVADQSLYFSERVCVSVILSPPNFYSPVIISSFSDFTIPETNDFVQVATVVARDDDTDLAGQIQFSIPRVSSTPQGGTSQDTTTANIFNIDLTSGALNAPDGLDAEAYTQHMVTVRASDMGNPIRFDEIEIQIIITDINDNEPIFSDGPYSLPSVTEAQLSFGVVGRVTAEDNDLTSPNNDIISYFLVTQDSRFSIDNSGEITYTEELDADMGDPNIVLTVGATDAGTPSLTGYTTVSFTIGEINDYEARVDQVSPALYVVEVPSLPQSIGPAMRINDIDLSVSTITSVIVKLTLNEVDRDRGYSTCLAVCQPERIQTAGLTTSFDLFQLPSPETIFRTDDGNSENLQFLQIDDTTCDSVRMTRGGTRESDGYGRIARSQVPSDFLSGDFSVSFVAKLESEGFVVIVPDETNPDLQPSDVNRDFAIWLRRRDLLFSYVYGSNSEQETLDLNLPGGVEFFNPTESLDDAETRHYTVVVSSSTSQLKVYVNCELQLIGSLMGQVVVPNPDSDVFIGQSRPSPVNSGRLGAEIHGLFYHPSALSEEQIESFCSCGIETLTYPSSIPSSISATKTITSTDVTLSISPTQSNIPEEDLVTLLREIRYENTFNPPTFDPIRPLEFTVEEDNNEDTAVTTGSIKLVSSDTTLPEIDLNGPLVGGIDYSIDFTEDGGAVTISNDIRLTRMVPSPAIATFSLIEVTLNNGVDADEFLSATTTNPFITVEGSGTSSITIQGPGDSSDFLNALTTVTYQNTNDRPTTNFERTIEFTVNDTKGDRNNPLAVATVHVIAVNDAPQLSLSGNGDTVHNVEYNEGSQTGVRLAPDISTVDVDNDVLQSARVELTSPRLSTDQLVIETLPTGLTSDYDQNSGVLTITGSASFTTFEDALRNITFESTDSPFLDDSGNPLSSTDRIVIFTVSDGIDDSDTVTVNIEFLPVDDPPHILGAPDMITFTEGGDPINIAPMVVLKDDDNDHLMSLQIDILAPLSGDVLSDGTTSSNLLRFDLKSLSEFQDILRQITYVNTADEPSLTNRTINIEVCDFNACDRVTVTINVEDDNDNTPVFDSAAYAFEVAEDTEVGSTIATITVSDGDDRDLLSTTFQYRTEPTVLPFLFQVTSRDRLEIIVNEELDAETETLFEFTLFASDGENEGSTSVSVTVRNVNEPPSITIETSATIVGRPNRETQLLQVEFSITDQDLGDSVRRAQLILQDIPPGSAESLVYLSSVDNVTFTGAANQYHLELANNANITLEEALRDVYYAAGSEVTETALLRSVSITVFDADGLESDPIEVTVSLASTPVFSTSLYTLSLTEGILHTEFFQVTATVENGGDTIDYAIEQNVGVDIDQTTGYLSLTELLDREASTTKSFEVYAVDNLPPARTGTATVTITVLDVNDVQPNVTISQPSITIFPDVPVLLLPNVSVSDPDISSNILQVTITAVGETALTASPLTGEVCVDNYQILQKMEQTCGLENYTDVLSTHESTSNGATLAVDENSNLYLNNTNNGHVNISTTHFSFLSGTISELTTAFWFRPEGSGYILYVGRQDLLERYYAIYYDKEYNQFIVTFKRAGQTGLEAQVRVIFQVSSSLCDGNWHFVMIEYRNRDLVCVVDAALVGSQAVVFKEEPFIGQVYGEFAQASKLTHIILLLGHYYTTQNFSK